jgi:ribosome-associated translation inhibitor RaiA
MLICNLAFTNFPTSPALESLVNKRIEQLSKHLDRLPRAAKVDVRLSITGLSAKGLMNQGTAEVEVNISQKQRFFSKTSGRDFQAVINKTFTAIEGQVRKQHEKDSAGRRTVGKTNKAVRAIKRSVREEVESDED